MINLTDPRMVQMTCDVKNKQTKEKWKFDNFIVVGFHETGETALIAADLRNIASAIDTLTQVYKTGMSMASQETRRAVEADIFLEACDAGKKVDSNDAVSGDDS